MEDIENIKRLSFIKYPDSAVYSKTFELINENHLEEISNKHVKRNKHMEKNFFIVKELILYRINDIYSFKDDVNSLNSINSTTTLNERKFV